MGKRKVNHPLPPRKKGGTQMTISELPPEMLEQVLHHLPMDDLKNARLVNKTWSQVAVAPMREKSQDFHFLYLDRGDYLNDFYDDLSRCLEKGDFPLDKFFFYLFLKSEHKTYETRSRSSAFVPKKSEFSLDSLFQMISPFVTELSLGLVGNKNNLKAENLPKKRDYPKLKSLNIFIAGWSQTGYRRISELWNGYLDFVREIVESSPKLERITLEIGGRENFKTVVVQFITDVFRNGRKIDLLTKIDLSTVTNPPADYFDWTELTTMGLKLRELELNLSRLILSNNLLRTFLESQSKSLVKLNLCLWANDWTSGVPAKFELPQLEKLEVLELEEEENRDEENFEMDEILITFPDINYQKRLPSLKQLHLCDAAQWQDFLKIGLTPSETLEELRFRRMDQEEGNISRGAIVLAAEIFPNLKRLQIYDEPAMATAVYENMPDLEELTLVAFDFSRFGEAITGLTEAECSSSKRLSKQLMQKLEISKANRKSLGCLENLHTLRIRGEALAKGDGIIPQRVAQVGSIVELFPKPSLAVLSAMDSLKRIDFFGGRKLPPLGPLKPNEKKFLETLKERFVVL